MKKPPANAAFVETVCLLLELHVLFRDGRDESPEADLIRDAMDRHWYEMTEAEKKRLRQLSADLYTIGDRKVEVFHADPWSDLGRARAAGDWMNVLFLLQEHPELCSPAARAKLRGEAWSELGVPEAANLFFQDALAASATSASSPFDAASHSKPSAPVETPPRGSHPPFPPLAPAYDEEYDEVAYG